MERVVLLRLRPGRRVPGRLAPPRPLPQPPGRLVDDLDRAARPPRRLLGRLPRSRSPRRTASCPSRIRSAGSRSTCAAPSRSSASPPAPVAAHDRAARGRLRPRARHRADPPTSTSTSPGPPTASPTTTSLTTRYEIPCLVTGTVTVDGETFTVEGQGQRDHSWGVRDWWAFGWCWCSHAPRRRHPGPPGRHPHPGDAGLLRLHPDAGRRASRDRPLGGRRRRRATASRRGARVDIAAAPAHDHRHRRHPRGLRARAPAQRRRPHEPVSRGRWCAAAPTTGARDRAGSSGTSPIRHHPTRHPAEPAAAVLRRPLSGPLFRAALGRPTISRGRPRSWRHRCRRLRPLPRGGRPDRAGTRR